MNLKEKADVWEHNTEKCKFHYENEIVIRNNEFEQNKELHEQRFKEVHDQLKATLQLQQTKNLEVYNLEKELSKVQFELQTLNLRAKRSSQQRRASSEMESALVTKQCSVNDAKLKKEKADERAMQEYKTKYDIAFKEKESNILKLRNQLKSLKLKSEDYMSKALLQISKERMERERKVWAIFDQKHKITLEIANSFLSNLELQKSAEYQKVKEEIAVVDNVVINENNDSITEASDLIGKFEEELKKKEEVIIENIKKLHLQNLLQSARVQLQYLEHNKLLQVQLRKAVSISRYYVQYATQKIESYLYTVDFFWNEILSVTSSLMKSPVARNIIELDHLKVKCPNKKAEIANLEINQKSVTFKTSAKEFYKQCSILINECSLTDIKTITAKENIVKLLNLAKETN